jgi:hypothetical protein
MKPPAQIKVGPYTFAVNVDAAAIDKDSVSERADLDGRFKPREQEILIRPGLGPDNAADTLLHEVLHAVFMVSGLVGTLGEEQEENVVTVLSPALLDALRRNPKLVGFLLQEVEMLAPHNIHDMPKQYTIRTGQPREELTTTHRIGPNSGQASSNSQQPGRIKSLGGGAKLHG